MAASLYFSVITPSFDQAAFIGGTIESVLAQNDPDFEHLVFDGGSTDETLQVLARYPHVHVVSEKDRGQSHAVNRGLHAARGEVMCWLNSDDQYAPGTFAALRVAFADPTCHVIFADARQVAFDGSGEAINHGRFVHRRDFITWWRREVKLHQPAIFFRRSVTERIGFLREDLHHAMDYEYWWRMSEAFEFRYLPRIMAIQQRQLASKTISIPEAMYLEREQIFAPHYNELQRNRLALELEKRLTMGMRHLESAWFLAPRDRRACARLLRLAAKENPLLILHPTWLGALARVIGGGRADHLIRRLRDR